MFSKSALTAVAMLGFSLVDAHMIMTNPVPYNKDDVDNSPLFGDGSNFPCKNVGYDVTTENHIVKGQPNTMQFEGGATHGGGSCQISITKDRSPTKDTQWSVIESIEGGCMDPNEGSTNTGNDASAKAAFSPSYTIPESFEDGEYTLAWTWINRIGNREFYMNCAPITLTSGSSSSKRSENATIEKRAEDYPPMFIANINGCQTEEGKSPRYPNPGPNVDSFNEANLIPSADDVCHSGSPTWGDAGMSSGGSSAQPTLEDGSSGAASTGAASTETAPAATESSTETSTPAVSIGGAVNVQPTEPAAVAPSSTFQSVAAAPTAAPTSSPSTSTEGALSGACTDEGAWNCISGSSFQRCASGTWTEVQALASGTECNPGQGSNFAVKAVGVKSRMLKEKRRRSTYLHGAHA